MNALKLQALIDNQHYYTLILVSINKSWFRIGIGCV